MTQPEDQQQPGVPRPPGWGRQEGEPQTPVYPAPPADPTQAQPPAAPPQQPQSPAPYTPAQPPQSAPPYTPGQAPQSAPPYAPGQAPQSAPPYTPGQAPAYGQGYPAPQSPGPYGHGYPQPQDPFQATTMTPPSAQLPPFTPVGPPKKSNKALIITAVALAVVLVLCAVGGVVAFLLLRDTGGQGAPSAREAAHGFLTAVYKDGDQESAEQLVCSEARDAEAIAAKIKEIRDQKAQLRSPSITWETPKITNETAERADTTVTVKLATADEKVSEQTLKLSLVKQQGWFVCEVREQAK